MESFHEDDRLEKLSTCLLFHRFHKRYRKIKNEYAYVNEYMEMVVKKRSDAIDMVKGLSIMTLFYLHFEEGWMNTDLNYFIVRSPAFYIVVGWLWGMSSNRRTLKEHWQKRKQGLVMPYLWFSLIFIVLDLVLLAISWIEPFILYRDVYKTLCLRGVGTLWFLPALLGGEMLFLSVRDRAYMQKIVALSISFFIICLYHSWSVSALYDGGSISQIVDAPLKVIREICNSFIYISIAYYISSYCGKKLFNSKKFFLFLIGSIALIVAFYLANHNHGSFFIPYQLVFVLYNLLAGIGVLLFFRSIETVQVVSRPLVYCGKNSLVIMTMHWALFTIALSVDKNLLLHETYSGFRTIVYFLISVILLIGIIELINRKLSFIIGR